MKLPDGAIKQARRLLGEKAAADMVLKTFLDGCKAGLGLEGEWTLDVKTWEFTKKE